MNPKIYIKSIYGGGNEVRMDDQGKTYIVENGLDLLEQLACERGWTENHQLGKKILRISINQ